MPGNGGRWTTGANPAPGPTLYPLNIIAAQNPGRKIPGARQRVAPTSPYPTVAQTGFNQSTLPTCFRMAR